MGQHGEPQIELEAIAEAGAVRLPVWPMVAGVAASAFVVDFVCSWLRRGTLPRIGLILVASSLLFTAVMVCGFVMRAIYMMTTPGARVATTPVMRAACLTALWIPAWVLFVETWSLLMLLAGCLCLASLGILMKRCVVDETDAEPEGLRRPAATPFQFERGDFRRMILPSLLLALLVEAAVILSVAHWFTMASVVGGVCAALIGWRSASKARMDEQRVLVSIPRQASTVVAALIFTVIALLPYLRIAPFRVGSILTKNPSKSTESAAKNPAASSDGYSGIILLPLSDEHKKIFAPVKREITPNFSMKIAKPLEIPFDGQYWYFKPPDKAPRPSARVVRGSPTKALIRSTDFYPLLMEAHQKLDTPIDLGCCSAIDLVVRNADRREGAIALELWVRKRPDAGSRSKSRMKAVPVESAPRYLGTATIPSSEQALSVRAATAGLPEERLNFPVPAAMNGSLFDELIVVVRPAPERMRIGAQVGIQKFVLEP